MRHYEATFASKRSTHGSSNVLTLRECPRCLSRKGYSAFQACKADPVMDSFGAELYRAERNRTVTVALVRGQPAQALFLAFQFQCQDR